jgi:transcriptional repressor NrdR
MKCPVCGHIDDRVIDSRLGKENTVIRRRRECLQCNKRFTTYERIEDVLPLVIKKDERREPFDRRKIIEGMRRACQKRPIRTEDIEAVAESIEQELMESPEKEIESSKIGRRVMNALQDMDHVAYVRFASVYRSFATIEEFIKEIDELQASKEDRDEQRPEDGPLNEQSQGFQDSP